MVEEMLAARGIVVSHSSGEFKVLTDRQAGACLALLMRSDRSTPDVAQSRLGRQLIGEVPYGRRGSASAGLALGRNAGG